MQYRMKTHPLTMEQINRLLITSQTGCLATIGQLGFPCVTPVHYVYVNGFIYFHGLPKGQKNDNIRANPHVSFNVYNMDGLLLDRAGKPCDTNTKYQSVIIQGTADFVDDIESKRNVLCAIVNKYTPHLSDKTLPDNMVKGTAIVEIKIDKLTGKYWE